ncbi:hypothetical protein [Streptomyces sp. cg35]|uniref:hypothetical protein n=1 Tax=Streptomyces sp. cg35 TaxID=3421650 RepID=UPI003D183574
MTDNTPSPVGPGPAVPVSLGDLLAGAVRPDAPGAEGERAALAAFRAARDSGAHTAQGRTRRRDDWRPRRRARWSLRAAAGVLLASVAVVGGVAVAGIGTGGSAPSSGGPERAPRPAPTVTGPPARTSPPAASPSRRTPLPAASPSQRTSPLAVSSSERPAHGRDRAARCTSYEKGRGLDRSERAFEACGTPTAGPPGKGEGRDNGHKHQGEK